MIYVDYTECIPKKNMKFHGGANYGKRMIKLLSRNKVKLILLVPTGFLPETQMDKELFSHENIKLQYIKDLESFVASDEKSILYIPMIRTRRLTVIKQLKANNLSLKVYVTIHGVRRLDLKPDGMDSYYSGSRFVSHLVKAWIKYLIIGAVYRWVFRKYVPEYDLLITGSNDSLQKIQNICTPKAVKIYYEGSINADTMMEKSVNHTRDNYSLIVSGGREEKNLLRTLIGFQEFKLKNPDNNLRLVVTGVNDNLKKRLMACPHIQSEVIEKSVTINGYVEDNELFRLYDNCKYVVYLSKSEGFGLPLIEACLYGAPCLASSVTAMPEVLGSAVEYANPLSIVSIADGFEWLEQTDYNVLQDKILRRRQVIIENIRNSDKDFLADFLNL